MGRIIAISSGDLQSTAPMNEYAVKLVKGNTKNLLFISTASHDAEGYIESMTQVFGELGCQVRALKLTTGSYTSEEIKEMVSGADIIYVGGGDTIFMMNTWKQYGLNKLLKEVYEKDTAVLMGISAGAICWFDCGCTDSELAIIRDGLKYGWANDMLKLHNYAFCPHYEDRVEQFTALLEEKQIDAIALESDTAFVEENGKVYYIKCSEKAKVFEFRYANGSFEKQEIKAENIFAVCGEDRMK